MISDSIVKQTVIIYYTIQCFVCKKEVTHESDNELPSSKSKESFFAENKEWEEVLILAPANKHDVEALLCPDCYKNADVHVLKLGDYIQWRNYEEV